MFYSQFILAKKGPLGTIWIAAHLERKLRKNQVADTDIGVSVDSILFPEVPIALRLSSHLLLGVVRIYSRKVNYLFHDCSEALLKIKQAFRSTAVDLPPEESTAPYHSITLPETFHLDDFEFPDAIFHGDFVDHHISTKEQITLQDNPERTGYSTSQFGLDERFGDGNASHIGLDLEEELLLNTDQLDGHALGSDDGAFIQGQSSVPTDMDVDVSSVGPSRNNKNNSNWNTYNIQTPDLNAMLFQNNDAEGPSVTYDQSATPFPGDEPMSPELVESAQAPSTPGLMEETIPSRVRESPVLSPQRKASPAINDDTIRTEKTGFPNLSSTNGDDVMHSVTVDHGSEKVMQVEPSGALEDVAELQTAQNAKDNSPSAVNVQENGDALVPHANSADGIISSDCPIETSNVEAHIDKSTVDAEVCSSPLKLPINNFSEPGEPELVHALSVENGPVEVEGEDTHVGNATKTDANLQENIQHSVAEDITGNDKINEQLTLEFPEVEKLRESELVHALSVENGPVEVEGEDTHVGNATKTDVNLHENIQHSIAEDMTGNDKINEQSTLEFPEVEKLRCAPHFEIDETIELGQITAERGVAESDGSVSRISTLTGKKRRLMDSLALVEYGSTGSLSTKSRIRRNNDFVPDDDDLLASILVGKKTPGLRIGPTPSLPKAASSKRPRLAAKTGPKRKMLMDDPMVLNADTIRQQLVSTEDIRRIRKKAPCTRSEIWIIEKGSLEDEIFNESIFTCASAELNNLQHRTYSKHTTSHLMNRDMEQQGGQGISLTTEAQDSNNAVTSGAKEQSTPHYLPQMEISNGFHSDIHQGEPNDGDTIAASGMALQSGEQVNHEYEVNVGDILSHEMTGPSNLPDNSPLKDVTVAGDESVAAIVGNSENAELSNNASVDTEGDTLKNNIDCQQDFPSNGSCLDAVPTVSANEVRDGKLSSPDVVMEGLEPASTAALEQMKDKADTFVNGEDIVYDKMPNSEVTGAEGIEGVSGVPSTTGEENMASTMGENSGLQETNFAVCMDGDSIGQDFGLKECSDFGSAIQGVDTDFLNVDDEVDYDEEANNDVPNPQDLQSLDNSGWSSRTRGVARYLQTLFDEESGLGRKSVAIDHLLRAKTRKEASRMFFETLVLKTKDYIDVQQGNPFDLVNVKPGIKLMKSEF